VRIVVVGHYETSLVPSRTRVLGEIMIPVQGIAVIFAIAGVAAIVWFMRRGNRSHSSGGQ
jgi:hypothetical protein